MGLPLLSTSGRIYSVPGLFTTYSPSDPYLENPGFDEKHGGGVSISGDDYSVCVNAISISVSIAARFPTLRTPASESCAPHRLAAQADKNTCSFSDAQHEMPSMNVHPQSLNFDHILALLWASRLPHITFDTSRHYRLFGLLFRKREPITPNTRMS